MFGRLNAKLAQLKATRTQKPDTTTTTTTISSSSSTANQSGTTTSGLGVQPKNSPALSSYHIYVETPRENAGEHFTSTTPARAERTPSAPKRRLSSAESSEQGEKRLSKFSRVSVEENLCEAAAEAQSASAYNCHHSGIPVPVVSSSHSGTNHYQSQGMLSGQPAPSTPSNQQPLEQNQLAYAQPYLFAKHKDVEMQQQQLMVADSHGSGMRTLEDYQLLNTLGTGTFGRVFLCQSKRSRRYYAMKVLRKSQVVKLKQVEHINNEKNILEEARHPFIVRLERTMQNERNLYMLMEYVPGGELFSHLRRAGRFPDDVARFYSAEIVLALDYLHSLKIIWRDTKPENILLDEHGHVKLTDFGFAKKVEVRTWTLCGTPEYLAPEIIQSKGHGKAVDWWALGILIFEMLAGYPPFYDDNPFGIYEKILEGKIAFPAFFSPAAKDLIRRLLNADVGKRLGNLQGEGEDVKRHPWFAMIDWQSLVEKRVPPPIVPPHRHPGDTCNFDKYPEPPQEPAPEPGVDPYRHLFSTF